MCSLQSQRQKKIYIFFIHLFTITLNIFSDRHAFPACIYFSQSSMICSSAPVSLLFYRIKKKKKKNRYFTKHIKLQAQIHYQTMHDPLRFLQRIYWQTSSAACFIERELQRFYYIIMYHHHLLYCWWDRCPLTARLSTRYQAVMQILQNNVATAKWNRPHITMYGFHLQEFHNMAIN